MVVQYVKFKFFYRKIYFCGCVYTVPNSVLDMLKSEKEKTTPILATPPNVVCSKWVAFKIIYRRNVIQNNGSYIKIFIALRKVPFGKMSSDH